MTRAGIRCAVRLRARNTQAVEGCVANGDGLAEQRLRTLSERADHALQTFFVIGLVARAALAELAPDRISDPVATALVEIIDVATNGREQLREAIFTLGQIDPRQSGVVGALPSLARD